MLRASLSTDPGLVEYSARDEFNQTAGALTGKTAQVGGIYAGIGDLTDFDVETPGKTAQRVAVSDTGNYGRIVSLPISLTNVVVQADFMSSLDSPSAAQVFLGVAARVDRAAQDAVQAFFSLADGDILVQSVIAGSINQLGRTPISSWTALLPSTWYTIRLLVLATGSWFVWVYRRDTGSGGPVLSGTSAVLATGGTLASGEAGLADWSANTTACTRNYDNLAVWAPSLDAVVHASQSAELRTDGMFREDSSGTAYGPVPHVVSDLPRLPGPTAQVFVKGSRGDFDETPDAGIDDISARVFYRPSWLFVA